jgi:hypothetical protein
MVDIDDKVIAVHGYSKQCSGHGYSGVRGLNALARHGDHQGLVACDRGSVIATPAICRQTRLTELVNDMDPKLTAVALGMNDTGLVRYAADNIARDRLDRRLTSAT